jgi:predicted amidohydrolase
MNAFWEDKSRNLKLLESAAKFASDNACDILTLPEMTLTGFSMNTATTAESPNGESEQSFAKIAKQHKISILAGLVEKQDAGFANLALFFDSDGSILAKYAKTHLFPLSGEDECHIPGEGVSVFNFHGTRMSTTICYDLRFPELFRPIASEISMIFVIANWPACRIDHWTTLLKARAIENQCFIVGANRTGVDPDGTLYSGHSAVFTPDGEKLEPLLIDGDILIFEFDPSVAEEQRIRFPFR